MPRNYKSNLFAALKLAAVNVKMSILPQDILPIFCSLSSKIHEVSGRTNAISTAKDLNAGVFALLMRNEKCALLPLTKITVSLFILVARDSPFVSFEDGKHARNTSFSSFLPRNKCPRSQCNMEDRKQMVGGNCASYHAKTNEIRWIRECLRRK